MIYLRGGSGRKTKIQVKKGLNFMSVNLSVSIFGVCATKLNDNHRWFGFISEIWKKGFHIVEIGDSCATVFISIDHSDENYKVISTNQSLKKKILILIEPPSINPNQYEERVWNYYDLLITTPTLSGLVPNSYTWIPGFIDDKEFNSIDSVEPLSNRDFKFGLLASNKYSPINSSLYQFRKQVLIEFSKLNILVFVGGLNWNQSWVWKTKEAFKSVILNLKYFRSFNLMGLFKSLCLRKKDFISVGKIPDSYDFYARTQFVICIESDVYDSSEKIFEVIEAGAIPLYLGPDLSAYNLPNDSYYSMPYNPRKFVEKAIEISNLIMLGDEFTQARFHKLSCKEWNINASFIGLLSICSVDF
jgi:hypothetical protein